MFRDSGPGDFPNELEIESENKQKEKIDFLMGRIPTSSGVSLTSSQQNPQLNVIGGQSVVSSHQSKKLSDGFSLE